MSHDHGHHAHTAGEHDAGVNLALLDLDGVVLHEYWADAIDLVRANAPAEAVRVVDLGAGSGTGTIRLAEAYPAADVTAIDVDEAALAHIRTRADARGFADRIHTMHADLDATWPDVGTIDITWASMSLHHLTDPASTLKRVFETTQPGGIIAVAEFGEPLKFLDESTSWNDLESRLHDAFTAEHEAVLPHLSDHWAPRLEQAGFVLVTELVFAIDLRGSHDQAVNYARAWFERMRTAVTERLTDDDRHALGVIIDKIDRVDLHIRGSRTVTIGRRPG